MRGSVPMDSILEHCLHHGVCKYQLRFNQYVRGESQLSAGTCPTCRQPTLVVCQGCQRRILTRDYLANSLVCGTCEGALDMFLKQRKISLADATELQSINPFREPLQPKEKLFVTLIVRGLSNKQIATELNMTQRSVETYRARIMEKLEVHSVVELAFYAVAKDLVTLDEMTARYPR